MAAGRSASSAAIAQWYVRTRSSGSVTTTSRRWRRRRPRFRRAPLAGRGFPNLRFTLQVAVEDCTGCELCVEVCPAKSLEAAGTRAINMTAKAPLLERERANFAFFETLPENARKGVETSLVRGVQYHDAAVRILRRVRGVRRNAVPASC